MKNVKRGRAWKKLLGSSLGFMLLLLGLFQLVSSAGSDPNDITSNFQISFDRLYFEKNSVVTDFVKEGKVISPAPNVKLQVGDELKLVYKWSIPLEKAAAVKDDTYFLIYLPNQSSFKHFGATEVSLLLHDSTNNEDVSFGTTKVVKVEGKQAIKVLFKLPDEFSGQRIKDSSGCLNRALENGLIEASVQAKAASSEVEVGNSEYGIASLKLVIEEKPSSGGGSGHSGTTPGFEAKKNDGMGKQDPIYKFGQYIKDRNVIHYNFAVNRDQIKKIYKFNGEPTDSQYENFTLSETFDDKNVVVIDELPDGLILEPENLKFRVPFYSPGLDDALRPIKNPTDSAVLEGKIDYKDGEYKYNDKTYFKLITADDKGTNPSINNLEALKNAVKTESSPVVGIWNKKYLMIDFKTVPDTSKTYSQFFANLSHEIDNLKDKKITNKQALYMKAAYTGNRPIVAYTVFFDATIEGGVKSEYLNTVYYENNSSDKHSASKDIYIPRLTNKFSLGPTSGKITVEKKWLGTPKWPVEVALLLDGSPVGKRLTLNDTSPSGTFTGLQDHRNYEIRELPVPGYRSVLKNLGNGKVSLTNIKQTEIKVEKVWVGAEESEKVSVSVNLIKKGDSSKTPIGEALELKADNSFKGSFPPVDAYDSTGEIAYDVVETTKVAGFTTSVSSVKDSEGNYQFKITNTKGTISAPPSNKFDLSFEKVWLDKKGVKDTNFADKPEIEVELFKKENTDANFVATNNKQTLSKSNSFKGAFKDLPELDSSNNKIKYEVREINVPDGYDKVQDGTESNSYLLTNKKKDSTPPPLPDPTPPGPTPPGPTPPPTIPIDPYPIPLGPTPPMPTPEPPSEPIVPKVEIYEEPKEKVPSVPPLIPLTEEELDDIDVDGDDVPRGNTEIEEEIDGDDFPEGYTEIEEPDDTEISPDGLPRGRTKVRKELARTGGSENKLHSLMGVFAFLLLGCFAVFGFKKLR